MSRRSGGDKLHNRKKEKIKRDFNRNKATLEKLDSVIMACEGIKTEYYYFSDFFEYLVKNHKISGLSLIIADHKNTHPTGVLKDLTTYNNKGKTYKDFKFKWIVIDRDEERTNGGGHTLQDYNDAIRQAKQLNIEVAYSNPSFEIWYLLHFQYRNTAIDRDSLEAELKELISYDKSNEGMFEFLIDNQITAIKNAKRLTQERRHNLEHCNPITRVYKLIDFFNEYAVTNKT